MLLYDTISEIPNLKYNVLEPTGLSLADPSPDKVLIIFNEKKMKTLNVDPIIRINPFYIEIIKDRKSETITIDHYKNNIYFNEYLVIASRKFFDISPSGCNIFIDDEDEMKFLMGISNII